MCAASRGSASLGSGRAEEVSRFRAKQDTLASDALAEIIEGHNSEIQQLWSEKMMLRQELERVVQLMRAEVLPRERMMHALIRQLQETQDVFHQHRSGVQAVMLEGGIHRGLSQEQMWHYRQAANSMQDMEQELARITGLLARPLQGPSGDIFVFHPGDGDRGSSSFGTDYLRDRSFGGRGLGGDSHSDRGRCAGNIGSFGDRPGSFGGAFGGRGLAGDRIVDRSLSTDNYGGRNDGGLVGARTTRTAASMRTGMADRGRGLGSHLSAEPVERYV